MCVKYKDLFSAHFQTPDTAFSNDLELELIRVSNKETLYVSSLFAFLKLSININLPYVNCLCSILELLILIIKMSLKVIRTVCKEIFNMRV